MKLGEELLNIKTTIKFDSEFLAKIKSEKWTRCEVVYVGELFDNIDGSSITNGVSFCSTMLPFLSIRNLNGVVIDFFDIVSLKEIYD